MGRKAMMYFISVVIIIVTTLMFVLFFIAIQHSIIVLKQLHEEQVHPKMI